MEDGRCHECMKPMVIDLGRRVDLGEAMDQNHVVLVSTVFGENIEIA